MNNETKIGLVKEWDSPRSNIQLFVPQEYCEVCYTDNNYASKGLGSVFYVDINNDTNYQTNERFYNGGNNHNSNLGPMTVDFYHLYGNDVYDTGTYNSTLNGKSYSGTYTAYGKTLKFKKIGSHSIKLDEHGKIWFNNGNAS